MSAAVNPRIAKSWGEFADRTYLPGRDPRPDTPGNAAALKSQRALTRAEYLALQDAILPADRVHLITGTPGDNPPSPAQVGRAPSPELPGTYPSGVADREPARGGPAVPSVQGPLPEDSQSALAGARTADQSLTDTTKGVVMPVARDRNREEVRR